MGPFASALSFILHKSNAKVAGLPSKITVYKGFQCLATEVQKMYKVDNMINLRGY